MSEPKTFKKELTDLLNIYGKDNECNTPDFILAAYLVGCIIVFKTAICSKERLNEVKESLETITNIEETISKHNNPPTFTRRDI